MCLIFFYITGLFFNFFDYYKKWQRFIQDNGSVSVHIVYYEELLKVVLEVFCKDLFFLEIREIVDFFINGNLPY